jgi:DNA (cytosine-5)-methyltransferase 1
VTAHYYNEWEAYAAQWLRNLIDAGHLPAGEVDERSIADVQGDDLRGFTQCHFFAGIGGWPLTLRLAEWPEDRPVWTGSCPCQPFSAAGKRKGTADERHLWPEFRRLIAECRPPVVLGEQVASKDGREWLSGVRADMEALGCAVGAADLCAASAGVSHIRQRLWWVADTGSERRERRANAGQPSGQDTAERGESLPDVECGSMSDGLGHAQGCERGLPIWQEPRENTEPFRASPVSFWSDSDWLPCLDGKARRVEPGTFPLAHGVSARVGKLRAYGNAIVPQVAAEFIGAYMECRP